MERKRAFGARVFTLGIEVYQKCTSTVFLFWEGLGAFVFCCLYFFLLKESQHLGDSKNLNNSQVLWDLGQISLWCVCGWMFVFLIFGIMGGSTSILVTNSFGQILNKWNEYSQELVKKKMISYYNTACPMSHLESDEMTPRWIFKLLHHFTIRVLSFKGRKG